MRRTGRGAVALVLGALVLLEACVTGGPWSASYPPPQGGWTGGGERGVPSHYAQSCMSHPLACSPAGVSGEIVGATAEKLVETVEVLQGLITLKDFPIPLRFPLPLYCQEQD